MSRIVPIRIRQADKQEYQRLVRNAKAKIRRTKKNYNRELSGQVNLPDITDFKTRQEFNAWKEEIRSFTNRGNLDFQYVKNKYDVVLSKREVMQLKQKTKDAQKVYDENMPDVAKLELKQGGKSRGTVGQRMLQMKNGNDLGERPREFDVENYRSLVDVKRDLTRLDRKANPSYYEGRMETMRQNFLSKLAYTFNSDADDLIRELQSMPLTHFYGLFKQNEADVFDFSLYDSEKSMKAQGVLETGVDKDENLIRMESEVERYNQGLMDMDFENL